MLAVFPITNANKKSFKLSLMQSSTISIETVIVGDNIN